MRVLIFDTYYRRFLDTHYARRPWLSGEPYDIQWRALMDSFFGTADAYSHYLGAAGHEAQEFVLNCEPLQRAWARERRVPRRLWVRRHPWAAIAVAQVENFDPDVVYLQDLNALPAPVLRRLARRRLLVGQTASALPRREQLEPFDLIVTSFPHYVERLKSIGVDSELLRIGFDPRVLDHVEVGAPDLGAVFVGSLARRRHRRGNDLLERAARRVPIDFWGQGASDWSPESAIRQRHLGEAWGLDMYCLLANARIAINRHVDAAGDYANNMRLYEATGVGALLLTDEKRNLSELFEPGREVVTYSDADTLVDRIRYYLENEDERRAIAQAGHERALREHTYVARMSELEAILASRLPKRSSRAPLYPGRRP